mmetsp:Transcript_66282/g.163283  ORF Transcript_66282/g.163283 Transcript_66282/m.163283 type:complete len:116 (-) Transcript_66282:1063-1410(-)
MHCFMNTHLQKHDSCLALSHQKQFRAFMPAMHAHYVACMPDAASEIIFSVFSSNSLALSSAVFQNFLSFLCPNIPSRLTRPWPRHRILAETHCNLLSSSADAVCFLLSSNTKHSS